VRAKKRILFFFRSPTVVRAEERIWFFVRSPTVVRAEKGIYFCQVPNCFESREGNLVLSCPKLLYESLCCFVDTLSRPFSVLSMLEKGGIAGCTEKGKGRVEKVGWDFFTKEMGRGIR
jgi:hypothetical protein